MPPFSRRRFLEGLVVSSAAAASATAESVAVARSVKSKSETRIGTDEAVDFRYAPRLSQATICFPDDPKKTLVGQLGDLRYGFAKGLTVGMEDFATVCTFSLAGMCIRWRNLPCQPSGLWRIRTSDRLAAPRESFSDRPESRWLPATGAAHSGNPLLRQFRFAFPIST